MDANKKGSLAERINFGGKNKAQEKPASGTQRTYGNMLNSSPWTKMGNKDEEKKV